MSHTTHCAVHGVGVVFIDWQAARRVSSPTAMPSQVKSSTVACNCSMSDSRTGLQWKNIIQLRYNDDNEK